ncbi:MAG: hypothetical protein HY235_18620 [Acidobacteria bacterium]|nr:hypothetical protein [Acidobacteriota bacterium]
MKRMWVILMAAAVAAAGQEQKKESTKPAAPAKAGAKTAAKPAQALPGGPPADAREIEPGRFRWVDPKGQAWIYARTPFGWMKGPETQKAPEPAPTDWKVTEDGDTLLFERPWPFGGVKRWTKRKTELTEIEQAVWKRAQESKPASANRE